MTAQAKPSIVAIIPHPPMFEIAFPVMRRLHERGRVAARLILRDRVRRTDPRVDAAVRASGIDARWRSVLGLELGALPALWRHDAVLSHTDPLAYRKTSRPRDLVLPRSATPLFLLQHGMFQAGLTYPAGPPRRFYADRLLMWDLPAPEEYGPLFTDKMEGRLARVGFLKENTLAANPALAAFRDQIAGARLRVLICHNFGWEAFRFDAAALAAAYDWIGRVAARRRDVHFILRGHRGRDHADLERHDAALAAAHPNITISKRQRGALNFSTIGDVMALADIVVTHPSTVVLDAVYADKPVAVLGAAGPGLAGLPQIDGVESLDALVADPAAGSDAAARLIGRYGVLDDNLDRAARVIEDRLAAHAS